MDEERVRRLLGRLEGPAEPDAAWSEALRPRLEAELRHSATTRHRLPLARLAVLAAVLALAAAAAAVGAVLLRNESRGLACVPDDITLIVAAARDVPGYRYTVQGTMGTPLLREHIGYDPRVDLAGEYQAPGRVRLEYRSMPPSAAEEVLRGEFPEVTRIQDTIWIRRRPVEPGRAEWISRPAYASWDSPSRRLAEPASNPLAFALTAPTGDPAAFTWSSTAAADADPTCRLTGTRIWSERNGARQEVEVVVDRSTRLPTSVSERYVGFRIGDVVRDRALRWDFTYPEPAPVVDAPPPAMTATRPPEFADLPWPQAPVTIDGVGSAVLSRDGERRQEVSVLEIRETTEFEGATALPGHIFLAARIRHHAFVDISGEELAAWWTLLVGGADDPRMPSGQHPARVKGMPEPELPLSVVLKAGSEREGWLAWEIPAEAGAALYHTTDNPYNQSELRLVLKAPPAP